MIELLECTCIEAYKARKMRDPNCCACSCDHNDLVEQLAKANERVKELSFKEGRFDQYALESEVMRKALLGKDRHSNDVSPRDLKDALSKFAIEQQIKGIEDAIAYAPSKENYALPIVDTTDLYDYAEQLRKEQE